MDLVLQLVVNGVINGSHYALLGIGFGLIFATTGVTHFAYGPFYALGAYAAWSAAALLGLPLVVAGAVGIAAAAAAGMLAFLGIYQPLLARRAPNFVILISSLGLYIVTENLIGLAFGTDNKVVPGADPEVFFIGPVFFTSWQVGQVAALAVVGALLAAFLRLTRAGKAILAMTDNPEMARIIGIDTRAVSLLVFALGSGISAIAATLVLLKDGAQPGMGFGAVFIAFVAVVVGGIGSVRGAVLGGLVLGMVENIGMWKIPTEWQSTIAFVVLFAVLLVRPSGMVRR